jgi:hypothetical protein
MEQADVVSQEYDEVFVKSYFNKALGRRIYAHEYGKQCFVLRFRRKRAAANDPPSLPPREPPAAA